MVEKHLSMVEGYILKQINKKNGYCVVKLESVSKQNNVTSDVGRYFCYNIVVKKTMLFQM